MSKYLLRISFVWIFLTSVSATFSQRIPLSVEQWYLPTEDRASFLYIHEVGKGEPVIVLHGGPGAGHQCLLDIAKGLENQFRFVFYDQRGAGLSFALKDNISMEKHVKDLERLRKALEIERINLISHSFGTMLAMNYLQAHPQNVKNIVLLGVLDPKNGDRSFFTQQELELFSKRGDEIKRFNERAEVQIEIEKAGLNKANRTPKEDEKLRCIKGAAGEIYYVNRWRQRLCFIASREGSEATRKSTTFVYDWSRILASHPFPITVINGEYDYVVGSKGSTIWKRVVTTETKNVNLVLIDKAGHDSWIDAPVVFRNALNKALTSKFKIIVN